MTLNLFDKALLSVHLSNGKGGWLWHQDDAGFRHYDLLKAGIVRGEHSWSLTFVIVLLLVSLSWHREAS